MNRSLLSSAIFFLMVLAEFAAGCTNVQQANTTTVPSSVTGNTISITAEGKTYPAYISVPAFYRQTPGNRPPSFLQWARTWLQSDMRPHGN